MTPTKTCANCGTAIVYDRLRHTRWDRVVFCSAACRQASRRVIPDRTCERCGTIFRPRTLTKAARFCSTECAGQAKRLQGDRDAGRRHARADFPLQPCEVCGAVNRPEIPRGQGLIHRHHRDGDQTNNDPSNIAFLCKTDHTAAHRAMGEEGIGRRGGGPRPRIAAAFRAAAMDRAATARELLADGLTTRQVAERMAVPATSVNRWLRKYPAA